ncbi:hypothetical protein J0B03_05525 [Alkalibacter rhizosphaerae]|uniref:Uncharacterized protein n=1 Tax=Alkalibacter rhizosphaerae TaxID=2815577 RepID=A0A974XGS1_9FIRM|nr:hypothetical protein [Alkalibacter rhizosphaerae]QSX09523.1 hypothetical protein J0B03_05525 [Alkalibacter rhizosphaerae]
MNTSIDELLYNISVFNYRLDSIKTENERAIIDYCLELERYLYDYGLICRRYQVYQQAWESFERDEKRNPNEKTLYELFIYLFIYSREEHMSGGYGGSYVRAFQNGTIPDIVRGLKIKLEEKANIENNVSDSLNSIGIAGENFVVAELTRRGYIALSTSKNTKGIDILVSDKVGEHTAAIQVKTCNNEKQLKWKLSNKTEQNFSRNLYYVFVNMNQGKQPTYYVVPSQYVAFRVKQDYEEWLATPGKNGKKHNETTMRTFEFVDQEEAMQYKDAWVLL